MSPSSASPSYALHPCATPNPGGSHHKSCVGLFSHVLSFVPRFDAGNEHRKTEKSLSLSTLLSPLHVNFPGVSDFFRLIIFMCKNNNKGVPETRVDIHKDDRSQLKNKKICSFRAAALGRALEQPPGVAGCPVLISMSWTWTRFVRPRGRECPRRGSPGYE